MDGLTGALLARSPEGTALAVAALGWDGAAPWAFEKAGAFAPPPAAPVPLGAAPWTGQGGRGRARPLDPRGLARAQIAVAIARRAGLAFATAARGLHDLIDDYVRDSLNEGGPSTQRADDLGADVELVLAGLGRALAREFAPILPGPRPSPFLRALDRAIDGQGGRWPTSLRASWLGLRGSITDLRASESPEGQAEETRGRALLALDRAREKALGLLREAVRRPVPEGRG